MEPQVLKFVLFPLLFWMLCATYASTIGAQKRAASEGFWMGFFLGPFGMIAAGFLDRRKKCPVCGGRLNTAPDNRMYPVCQHCHASLEEWPDEVQTRKETGLNSDLMWQSAFEEASRKLQTARAYDDSAADSSAEKQAIEEPGPV